MTMSIYTVIQFGVVCVPRAHSSSWPSSRPVPIIVLNLCYHSVSDFMFLLVSTSIPVTVQSSIYTWHIPWWWHHHTDEQVSICAIYHSWVSIYTTSGVCLAACRGLHACMNNTLEYFINIWSRGIRTLSSWRNPLSIPKYPNLGPMSPTLTPVGIPQLHSKLGTTVV